MQTSGPQAKGGHHGATHPSDYRGPGGSFTAIREMDDDASIRGRRLDHDVLRRMLDLRWTLTAHFLTNYRLCLSSLSSLDNLVSLASGEPHGPY